MLLVGARSYCHKAWENWVTSPSSSHDNKPQSPYSRLTVSDCLVTANSQWSVQWAASPRGSSVTWFSWPGWWSAPTSLRTSIGGYNQDLCRFIQFCLNWLHQGLALLPGWPLGMSFLEMFPFCLKMMAGPWQQISCHLPWGGLQELGSKQGWGDRLPSTRALQKLFHLLLRASIYCLVSRCCHCHEINFT